MNLFKQLTTSEINIPIPGTNSSLGISGISSIFMGMDFLNNLQNENAGRAFAHTAVTTTVTALGVASLEAGAIAVATAIGTESAMAFAASVALGTTPVGWTIAAGVAVSYVVGYAYKNNFLGIKDMANDIGDGLNKGIKDVGNAIDSGIKSIQKVFGW